MKILLTAMCLCLWATGCAKPSVVRTLPPPEAAALCRDLVEPVDNSVDSIVVAYGDAIDAYRECRVRHKALSDWAKGIE